ncbi:MAG: hypothetical protein ACR2GY_12260, partial [Phycisphaerales bacterium]
MHLIHLTMLVLASQQVIHHLGPGAVASACQDGTATVDRQDEARAVVEALLAHDRSISSIECQQEVAVRRLVAANPQGGEWDEWAVIRNGRFGEDSSGNWYFRGQNGGRSTPDGPVTLHEDAFVSDTFHTVAFRPGANLYIIWEPQQHPRYFPGPFQALGRWLDTSGTKRLGELLLDADDLTIQDVDGDDGLILLRGEAMIDGVLSMLLVTVDRTRSFAPVVIRRFDANHNYLAEVIMNEAFELVEGVHVPSRGTRTLYTRAGPSPEETRGYDAALQRAAMKLKRSVDDPQVVREAASAFWGQDGWPVTPVGGVMNRYHFVTFHSINRGLDTDSMRVRIAPDAAVFNNINGLDNNPQEGEPLQKVIEGYPFDLPPFHVPASM